MIKTFVVTGAGTGIGRATAITLSKIPNTKLILVARTESNLKETLSLLDNPSEHMYFAMDICDKAMWRKHLAAANASTLNISGVFANAGLGGENIYGDKDRWHDILNVNLTGTYITIQELLPYIRNSSEVYRNIVMTSSCLARFGVPGFTAYCTAKAGLLGLTKALALEFANDKILVNAILPGWVETEMAKASIQRLATMQGVPYEKSFDEQMSYVPLNRISQPNEIAALVKFLLTNEQTSMTGQGIDINNGSFMI